MLLYFIHTTGIRVTELVLLEVGNVLYPRGGDQARGLLAGRDNRRLPPSTYLPDASNGLRD